MGYRSDITIAIHKSIIARDLIAPIIPAVLKQEPSVSSQNAVYWQLKGWKWYASYTEVQDLINFFVFLDDEPEIQNDTCSYPFAVYGFIRIGENDDDVEEQGEPSVYDMQLERFVSVPVSFG